MTEKTKQKHWQWAQLFQGSTCCAFRDGVLHYTAVAHTYLSYCCLPVSVTFLPNKAEQIFVCVCACVCVCVFGTILGRVYRLLYMKLSIVHSYIHSFFACLVHITNFPVISDLATPSCPAITFWLSCLSATWFFSTQPLTCSPFHNQLFLFPLMPCQIVLPVM